MKKKVFKMALRDGLSIDQSYYPIVYSRMCSVYGFALHKSNNEWIVSDPISGYKLCMVKAYFKGMPVASGHLTIKQAMQCALSDVDSIVDRIGFDAFDNRINEARNIIKSAQPC